MLGIQRSALLWLAVLAVSGSAQEFPVRPYVDPSQLEVEWPKHSHYKQPWRAFLETRSGHGFLRGIGINYNVHGNHEEAVRLLAEAGFKTFRIEVGWGSVRWDESGLTNEKQIRQTLELCRRYGIRPTMLLNAHQGVPCPVRFFRRTLLSDAPKGARKVRFDNTDGIVVGRSGISGLTDYWAAEALITEVDSATGECALSKPLPKALKAGPVDMATLKYLPLYPVGTRQFDETAAGWVRYALMVCRMVRDVGMEDFDIEIWNELTFGTKFLRINNYHEPDIVAFNKDFLNEGGQCWELARRTIDAVKRQSAKTRCIWGFSNTTFYHTPIEKLPPMTDGHSYHPYGTGTRKLPEREQHPDRPEHNLEGFTPTIEIRMPEGWAHTFVQTECLMRLLNPKARKRRPAGTKSFYHYITEHGVNPPECGIHDDEAAWDLKAKCALRSFCLWLNKGIDVVHYYCARSSKAQDMGLMPPNLEKIPSGAPFKEVATPPLRAVRNLTRAFADSVPLEALTPLDVDVVALGEQHKVFEGQAPHHPLWHRDVFAFLPFQVSERKFVIAVYVVTYDITKPMSEERYRLTIRNLPASPETIRLYDPLRDVTVPVRILDTGPKRATVEVSVVDYPRLLILEGR